MPAIESRGKNTDKITETRIQSPELVFQKLFECYHLDEIAAYLNDIKQWVVNKNYPFQLQSREYDNLAFFFEKLLNLAEAAWHIESKRQAEDKRIQTDVKNDSPIEFHELFDKVDALYDAASYLHEKKQNELSCYLLQKTVLCAYYALLISSGRNSEHNSRLEELAKNCSNLFKGLPNPFDPRDGSKDCLSILPAITLESAFGSTLKIEDHDVESMLRQVTIIRRDVCEYYENRIQGKDNT